MKVVTFLKLLKIFINNIILKCTSCSGAWIFSGNKVRAEEQRKKEKALKEEQKRAYGAILQLKQRQRAEV